MASGQVQFGSLITGQNYRIESYGEDVGSGTFDRYQQVQSPSGRTMTVAVFKNYKGPSPNSHLLYALNVDSPDEVGFSRIYTFYGGSSGGRRKRRTLRKRSKRSRRNRRAA